MEQNQNPNPNPNPTPQAIKWPHRELIAEYNVNRKDLPEDLQKKLNGVEMRVKMSKSQEKVNEALKMSVVLADEILTYLERDLPEEEVEPNANPQPVAQQKPNTPPKAPETPPAPVVTEKKNSGMFTNPFLKTIFANRG